MLVITPTIAMSGNAAYLLLQSSSAAKAGISRQLPSCAVRVGPKRSLIRPPISVPRIPPASSRVSAVPPRPLEALRWRIQ